MICPSCTGRNLQEIGPIPATNLFGGQALSRTISGSVLYYCKDCSLRFKHPRLSDKDLEALYSMVKLDHWNSAPSIRPDWKIAQERIVEGESQGDILDIGCFDGGFFTTLPQTYGFYGVEINSLAAKKAQKNGIQLLGTSIDSMIKIDSNKFDVITAFDVVEHIENPIAFLKEVIRMVRPGGLVIISTGNAISNSYRLLGNRYYYVANAEHISFISPQWCNLHATELGVDVEDERRFSHATLNNVYIKIRQVILNLTYRFLPLIFAWVRGLGWSDKDVKLHPELVDYPPNWMTAKDHFITKFRKH